MGRLSFRRDDRLVKKADFEDLKAIGKKTQTPHFIIVTRPSPTGRSRLGITASARIGHAPQRNRVKRLLREFFRLHKGKIHRPLDIHIIVRKGSVDMEFHQVCEEIERHLCPPGP